ncbi:MAG: helicase-related protein [Pyrinomonadaceae bacterium]
MSVHIANRERIISSLKEELIGPSPQGEELDCTKEIIFSDAAESYKPWRQAGSGEEILQRDAPLNRYGAGVLYPFGESVGDAELVTSVSVVTPTVGSDASMQGTDRESVTERAVKALEDMESNIDADDDDGDLDLSAANKYLPSSMGITFLAEFPAGAVLVVEARGARYVKKPIRVEERQREWWLRLPLSVMAKFSGDAVRASSGGKISAIEMVSENSSGLDLRVEVFVRPRMGTNQRLVTACFINRTKLSSARDELSIFQSTFRARVVSPEGEYHILAYPEGEARRMDEEEESLVLLYRAVQTYAVGHGCAANWGDEKQDGKTGFVSAECFPVSETPSITPDVTREDGSGLEIPMQTLAGLVPGADGFAELSTLVSEYEAWIMRRREEVERLGARYKGAAERHLAECARCVERMRDGLEYLRLNERALVAFRLANHAVLIQQARSEREPRKVAYDGRSQRMVFSEPYPEPDLLLPSGGRGKWRAFQIAFLLMTLRSSVEGDALDRETVELIWFPTGGGKTEAYLGLTAFSLFMRRLVNTQAAGVHVLMRYTLRLLTAQQFQRACGLICAMEHLRRSRVAQLGEAEFSIGLWLGAATTPNTRETAIATLRGLESGKTHTENLFILSRCPWCRAYMGVLDHGARAPRHAPNVVGYQRSGPTVVFKCPDAQCVFAGGLPTYVIDEDIYAKRPSLVIGTVDKFAMLAWRPDARALFGIDSDGKRRVAPPGLIIQDELHLISGPLGSIVGLYETIIEELCTDRRDGRAVPPKIISSTATIRRFAEQIKALYAREQVALFPPPGLDASDSFFARYARNADGTLAAGRKYVGVNAPGLGSLQNTEVRTYTALLQAPLGLTPEEQDPWWTLLIFFNNLRMLGNSLSLFQSNVPGYFKVAQHRTRTTNRRYLDQIKELTGRLRSDEVPSAISALEVSCTSASGNKPVDVCLASNIIEVGVDIDRLSLMAVIGQPKTTSQYIQVTGRVGRKWWERPGVVVSIYSPSKPRDRSHFEKFRSYHERLYAQVEPTSVTPFSPPALDRALHAVMAAYVRQTGDETQSRKPYPYPEDSIERLREIILPRIRAVDPEEEENFENVFDRRAAEWKRWERTRWDGGISALGGDMPLMRAAGAWVSREDALVSWATQQSMRNVDAEAQIEITRLYLHDGDA